MSRLLVLFAAAVILTGCAGSADIPYPTLEAKYGSPDSRFADLDGVRVHYRDQGRRDAPVVVMVHGFSASLHTWEPWVDRLKGDYRVISLDLPGHGLTRAPAGYRASPETNVALVDALSRKLGADRFALVGNSMGGMVAWSYAMAYPERLSGLVLVDAAGWPRKDGAGGPPWFVRVLGPAGRGAMKRIDPAMLARPGLKSAYVDPALVTPQLVDRYVELVRAPGHRDIILTMRSAPAKPVGPDAFKAIAIPTLVMHGEADALIPVADGRAFAAAIPGAVLVTYPGVGHVPMEQIPDRSVEELRRFLSALR